jgi:hypothetical protein
VRLVCPLCRTEVVRDAEPEPGTCPGCGALVRGGGDDPLAGVGLALAQLGGDPDDAPALASALFAIPPGDPRADVLAVTSDEREGFYRWWVVVREEDDAAALAALEALAG